MSNFTVQDLRYSIQKYVEGLGVRGYSRMNKKKLEKIIANNNIPKLKNASTKTSLQKIRTQSAGVKGKINKLQKQYKKLKEEDTEEREKLKKEINDQIAVFNSLQKQIKMINN